MFPSPSPPLIPFALPCFVRTTMKVSVWFFFVDAGMTVVGIVVDEWVGC